MNTFFKIINRIITSPLKRLKKILIKAELGNLKYHCFNQVFEYQINVLNSEKSAVKNLRFCNFWKFHILKCHKIVKFEPKKLVCISPEST